MKLNATVSSAAKRYALTSTAPVRDDEGNVIGRAGIGADKRGACLVFESGQAQTGVPVAALVAAITDAKVIAPGDLVEAFKEAGCLPALVAAVEKASK